MRRGRSSPPGMRAACWSSWRTASPGWSASRRPSGSRPRIDALAADRARAAALGQAGCERVRGITWDHVIDTLLQAAER